MRHVSCGYLFSVTPVSAMLRTSDAGTSLPPFSVHCYGIFKSHVALAAAEWIWAFQSPPHALHQNLSRSPSGVRSEISFLAGWQLWNRSLYLCCSACSLPWSLDTHPNYRDLRHHSGGKSVTAALESPNADGSFCSIQSTFLGLLALVWPSFSISVWLLFVPLPRAEGASLARSN